uniref:NADH dehydrogenase [ubiquinone] 1 alpha subcomplex assembly factor 3 n=1 Tax=Rhabditophanes sp. KR3021 TaxID=114890 RepID=A0AC35TNA5_9BILA
MFLRQLLRGKNIQTIFTRTRKDDSGGGVIGGYNMIPMGKSDVGNTSRLSYLSKDMLEANKQCVHGLSCLGFRMIDGSFLYGPIAVFPKTVLSWRVLTVDDITPESLSLFLMLQPKLDILVLGVGDKKNIDAVRKRIIPVMQKYRIGLELMPTEEAIATFNFLNSEDRYVAAALYPPDDLVVTDLEYGQAMNLIRNFDELEENPLGSFASGLDRTRDIVRDIWAGKDMDWFYKKRAAVETKLLEVDERREQIKKPEDRRVKQVLISDKKKTD